MNQGIARTIIGAIGDPSQVPYWLWKQCRGGESGAHPQTLQAGESSRGANRGQWNFCHRG